MKLSDTFWNSGVPCVEKINKISIKMGRKTMILL